MDISVITVNYNAAPLVRRAHASLRDATAKYSYETIVIDNSPVPTDDCGADIYRTSDNRGFGAGCNEGAKLASGHMLLFLNPDCELHPGSLDAAVDCLLNRKDAGLVGLRAFLPDGKEEPACLRGFPTPGRSLSYFLKLDRVFPKSELFGGYHMTMLDRAKTQETECVSGSFMLLRRELFEQLGGFDETYFMYGEDIDLCWRVRKSGRGVWYCADGTMLHHHGKCGRNPRQTAAFYDSMEIFYDQHFAEQYSELTGLAVKTAVRAMKRRALRKLEAEK